MNTSILKILSYRAQNQCNEKAYIFLQDGETESASLTYGELDKQARVIASHLQSLQGERALLLYHSGLEFITAFFGCLYAGVIAVPVYPPRRNQKLSRLLSIVNDSQPIIALTTTSILTDIEQKWSSYAELNHLQLVATDTIESNGKEFLETEVSPDSLAFLQYTSGSTGTPKGVMVTHGNIIHNQQMIETAFEHSEKTISAGWLPLFHDMGLIWQVMHPMYLGTPCIMMPPVAFLQKPIRWLKVISKYRVTTSGGPNFAYDLCVNKVKQEDLADLDLSSWDLAFNGAEPVRRETLKKFSEKFAACGFKYSAFYPCYGMAETTLFTTGGEKHKSPLTQGVKATDLEQNLIVETDIYSPESRVFVGCGNPYLDTNVIIVNPESLTDCSPRQVGEIWVSSPSVAAGYWNRPDTTKETFQAYVKDTGNGPFLRTGDLGFVNHGELFVTGRLKDLIIIRGRNYYPQDIELTVEKSHEALRPNCGAAFSVEVEGEERLVVVQEVERIYVRKLTSEQVVAAINQAVSLEHELAIDTIVLLKPGSISKTSSGKIQRSACRQKFIDKTLKNVILTRSVNQALTAVKQIEFSLLYFSSNEAEFTDNKYKLLLEGAKFADQNNFHAVWIPERHFHPFGGLYPEPSVLGSALAMVTENIRIRPGSVVLPLQNPVRVAEQWSVVDNLSGGRVDLSFARGWNPNDFVLAPENYTDRTQVMFDGIKTVQKLWRGESINLPNGIGEETEIKIYPLPKQPELPTWITCSGGKERFIEAGASGANILTALLFQPIEELAEKIKLYRDSRAKNGYEPDTGHVTFMLHTFVSDDLEFVRQVVRQPFMEYLESSIDLWKNNSQDLEKLTSTQRENLLAYAFERYFQTTALFGTPSSCLKMVDELREIGVDEIACLIDFGVDADSVLSNLGYLHQLRNLANGISQKQTSEESNQQIINPQFAVEKFGDSEQIFPVKDQKLNESLRREPVDNHQKNSDVVIEYNDYQQQENIANWIEKWLAKQKRIKVGGINRQASFADYGMDSILAVELVQALENWLKISLDATILWNFTTIESLAQYLVGKNKIIKEENNNTGIKSKPEEPLKSEIEISVTEELAALEKLL
ncbi:MupA/Atu3671 family FMN-dependent luciferase-like monooxygenase [Calothrix rhizosoleniae]|uniref:MupA/Atu3671 family FMN-dependent luciferase-like monooxygenase n=1 Tax=Calothrix rhizosoleniae TaxID=888997 RepID=UPI001F436C8D|nr:MupA/Atu3671 family FMN-dependent luciferase-like monooxygenase [Calothrix rhizosoleniae]